MDSSSIYASESKNIAAADLQNMEHELIINGVTAQEFEQTDPKTKEKYMQTKLILSFTGAEKGLVLNRTNWSKIAAQYGAETDDWIGKAVILYPDVTTFGNDTVDCVRVRIPLAKAPVNHANQQTSPPTPPSTSEIDDSWAEYENKAERAAIQGEPLPEAPKNF